jgi:hypothetical protein
VLPVVHGQQDRNKKKVMAKATKKLSVSDIAKHAKKIRMKDEAWTSAIKRAARELKR